MFSKEVYSAYPVAWISESPAFMSFMRENMRDSSGSFFVADFASGEHDRVPSFILKVLPEEIGWTRDTILYSIDVHPLRLESLYSTVAHQRLERFVRPIEAKLEEMDEKARLLSTAENVLKKDNSMNNIDQTLIRHGRIPLESFDLGILNNDIIGYLNDYYRNSSNLECALVTIRKTLKSSGMLIVTTPSQMNKIDNIKQLEDVGFTFKEAIDVVLDTGEVIITGEPPRPSALSRIGHYSALFFVL